jgi:hypothetical protein
MPPRHPVPVTITGASFLGIPLGAWMQAGTVALAAISVIWTAGSWVQKMSDTLENEIKTRVQQEAQLDTKLSRLEEDHRRYETFRDIPAPQRQR